MPSHSPQRSRRRGSSTLENAPQWSSRCGNLICTRPFLPESSLFIPQSFVQLSFQSLQDYPIQHFSSSRYKHNAFPVLAFLQISLLWKLDQVTFFSVIWYLVRFPDLPKQLMEHLGRGVQICWTPWAVLMQSNNKTFRKCQRNLTFWGQFMASLSPG